jgi:hypothetical protein
MKITSKIVINLSPAVIFICPFNKIHYEKQIMDSILRNDKSGFFILNLINPTNHLDLSFYTEFGYMRILQEQHQGQR